MNDYKFGNFLCQLRTEKELSQSQLGNMMGVSNKAVSKWEMGVSKPRPAMLVTLATFFGVTVEELLAGEKKAETENENCKESKDATIKLWAGEYLRKKKCRNIAVLMAILFPIILFVWVGVTVALNATDKIFAPIGAMAILFAEAIDIALILVFNESAQRLKRILYATYHEQESEVTAIISPAKQKVPMLKWERICIIISYSFIVSCNILRLIILCLVEPDNKLHIFNTLVLIAMLLAVILAVVVYIHYCIRIRRINKQR